MLLQLFGCARAAMAGQVGGGCHHHATVPGRQRQGDIVGVLVEAIADGDVHRVTAEIGHLVGKEEAQAQRRVLAAKRTEPGQQQVAADVGRRGHLQHPAQGAVAAVQLFVALAQGVEHALGGGQVEFALGGQAQAAGGAGEQAHVEVALQALDRGGHLPGQQVSLMGSGGEAAKGAAAHEQFEVGETKHFHSAR